MAGLLRAIGARVGRWPNRCAVCQADGQGAEGRLCTDCVGRYAAPRPRCGRCALPAGIDLCGTCLRDPPPWTAAHAACDYAYPWDGLLTALKFHAALDLVPALAARLAAALPDEPGVDLVLPVPLAAARLRERGYNQAALLAQALAARRGLRCEPTWLLRIAETAHQTDLPRAQRVANLRGAFAVEPHHLAALRGRRVALVDDVMTTGATLGELARTVLAAGATEVQAWVVARTPE
jgi:ComF family protein